MPKHSFKEQLSTFFDTQKIVINSLNEFTVIMNYCGNELCHNGTRFRNGNCRDNYKQFVPSRLFYRGESQNYNTTSNVAGIYRGNYEASALYHAYMRR